MNQSNAILKSQQKVIETSQESSFLKQIKERIKELQKSYEQKKATKSTLTKKLRQLLEKKQFLTNQKSVQQRKYKSLNLLVNELQGSYQKFAVEIKSKQLMLSDEEDSKVALENHILRQELIKLNETCKQDEKLYAFLKQMEINKNNLNQFIAKSNQIESQTQVLAQIRSYIKALENTNLECRRKWAALRRQKTKNDSDLKIYKIQQERQHELLKSLYQEYLQKINTSKAKIVSFNQTQKEKLLKEYLVQQVALIQQKRRQVEDQNRNLHYHMNQLTQEWERIEMENKEFNSFFMNDNRSEESKLALKMKTRIEELTDNLIELQTKNSISSILNKKESNLEFVRLKLTRTKEANDFLEMKQKNIEEGKYSHLDEKQIAQFFIAILNSKDQKFRMTQQRCQQMTAELRELTMKEMLLESQVSNMEEVLKENSIESDFKRNELYKNYL